MWRAGPGLALVFFHHILLAGNRLMHGVMRDVEKEGPGFVRFDELHGLGGLAVGEELPRRAFGQRRNLVGRDVTRRLSAMVTTDVLIKAMLLRCHLPMLAVA